MEIFLLVFFRKYPRWCLEAPPKPFESLVSNGLCRVYPTDKQPSETYYSLALQNLGLLCEAKRTLGTYMPFAPFISPSRISLFRDSVHRLSLRSVCSWFSM